MGVGEVYRLLIPGEGVPASLHDTVQVPGMVWQGQIEVVSRIIKGYDPEIDLADLPEETKDNLGKAEYIIYYPRMSLQDAVELAVTMINITAAMQRFTDGTVGDPGNIARTGGDIDVALVTRDRGFEWLRQKELHIRPQD